VALGKRTGNSGNRRCKQRVIRQTADVSTGQPPVSRAFFLAVSRVVFRFTRLAATVN